MPKKHTQKATIAKTSLGEYSPYICTLCIYCNYWVFCVYCVFYRHSKGFSYLQDRHMLGFAKKPILKNTKITFYTPTLVFNGMVGMKSLNPITYPSEIRHES